MSEFCSSFKLLNYINEPPHEKNQQYAVCENKGADQLRSYCAFVFATRIVQSLYFLNTKFHASSCLLLLCSPVCVGPGRNPHCWFSHEAAQIFFHFYVLGMLGENTKMTYDPKSKKFFGATFSNPTHSTQKISGLLMRL